MLRKSTDNTVELLRQDLEIRLKELQEQWHFASLERIFIENRIYKWCQESGILDKYSPLSMSYPPGSRDSLWCQE